MTNFDYKKYSLEKLEEWIHDTLNGDATPQEIYDVIKRVVDEQYHYHKHHAGRCYELLALLNGNGKGYIQAYDDYLDDGMRPWGHSDLEYLLANDKKEDKVVKWRLPVQQIIEEGVDNYFVQFPDDLLEAANLKEGDTVEWVDQGDGSYLLKKVEKTMTYDEAIAAGWTMTGDGFWIKEKDVKN